MDLIGLTRAVDAIKGFFNPLFEPPTSYPPMVLGGGVLWDAEVRDTDTHNTKLMRIVGDSRYVFHVENLANQTVTLQLRGNIENEPDHAGNMSDSVTIAANTIEPVTVSSELWACWVGLQISYASAPTAGGLRITGRAEGYR